MTLRRRTFLSQAGLALAGLGLSEAGLIWLSDRYQQALAQPTRRKLALLVGINQYSGAEFSTLAGCLTDVELQRELLIYRFGFQPSDIQVLTDQAATRSNIETAFTAHLAEQARPGDLVVFHFSGYGQRVQLPNAVGGLTAQSALIPFDGWVPSEQAGLVNDLLADTLLLLLRSLPTDQVTTVLDAGFTDPGWPRLGNLRVRSCPAAMEVAAAEQAVRSQLLEQTQLSAEQVRVQWLSGQVPGLLMSATQPNQTAVECQWREFSAGAFTYALTQHLWQTSPPITLWISLNRAISHVQRQVGRQQHPLLGGQISSRTPSYDLTTSPAADGVVLAVDAPVGEVSLAGLPAQVFAHYGVGSVLAVLPWAAAEFSFAQLPHLQLQTITGLTVKAKLLADGQIQPGQLVQESIRVLPRRLSLAIALAPDLERIERVDAVSGFASLAASVPTTVSEQAADYLFAQAQPETGDTGYGLFSLAGNLLPNTLGPAGEAAKQAIKRLQPKLSVLLGQKLLDLTVNDGSSRLGVRAALEVLPPDGDLKVWRRLTTLRAPYLLPEADLLDIPQADLGRLTLPIGSQIRYRVQNYSDRPLYALLLSFSGDPFFLYPFSSAHPESKPIQPAPILPGSTVALPRSSIASDWIIRQTSQSVVTYLVFSDRPFSQAISALVRGMAGLQLPAPEQIVPLTNPLEVAQAVLADLDQHSLVQTQPFAKDAFAWNVDDWATFSFSYQVE
ncbi:MAG: caspase family protein [Aphanocapsa sp. GSE-SYN-MK-11-07L]|jgi:hypothetical protein|nr:caspase family protein [Aphanocapsa sp. GSE-SYN-MK-11-07L]